MATAASSAMAGSMGAGTGTARRCEDSPSGTSSAGGREEAAVRGGERRTEGTGASAGRWDMGRAATGGTPRSGSADEVGSGSASGAAATITGRGAGWMGNTQGGGARVSIPIRLILARERWGGRGRRRRRRRRRAVVVERALGRRERNGAGEQAGATEPSGAGAAM